MVIIEYQWCNTKHECNTDEGRCNTPDREYNLPDAQRESWIDFFRYLVLGGVIEGFKIEN